MRQAMQKRARTKEFPVSASRLDSLSQHESTDIKKVLSVYEAV